MISMKTLDLRYNELWNDFEAEDEHTNQTDDQHGQLMLSWKNLNVSVEQTTQKFFKRPEITTKKILNNVSGSVQSGTLLGIMGPSGSGKTTLMAAISYRMKGNFDGELLLNGRPTSEKAMINLSGFVPQHDIVFDQLTADEHLHLMASLRADRGTAGTEVRRRVERATAAAGADAFAGSRMSLLSGGERKKVALAAQLLNDPPVLFCDEITTGLDSYSAARVVNTLRAVARTGKIVVCTIHQPASGVLGKFDEVLLLSDGRLVCQGPVSAVRRMFARFDYQCPDMFNEADFVISILNSDSVDAKRNVDEMCRLSSTAARTDAADSSDDGQKDLSHARHLQTKKPLWITQFSLIFNRSVKCFLRSYKTNLLELGTIWLLGVIISLPFANIVLDSHAAQNLEGFWMILVSCSFMHLAHSSFPTHHVRFSIVHREIHNEVYPLSAYFAAEFILTVAWTAVKVLFLSVSAFIIIGIQWGAAELIVIGMVAFSAMSYGSLLSASFAKLENVFICATAYDFFSLPTTGSYLSLKSIPKPLFFIRFFSLQFLGCESASVLFWGKIPYLPCNNEEICLNSGEAVLNKYGYMSDDFYFNITLMILFCVLANFFSYFGVRKKMKRSPAY